ncbi:MAG: glycosyltransferase family 2 protein, partial [Nanoarchaeota archaeon]
MNERKLKAVVCLPTRNERESISDMIDRIKALKLPLFISDEQSTDGTLEIAKKKQVEVFQRDGSGKGAGVQKAVEIARKRGFDVLVIIDCDCTYPPEYIPKLLARMPKYDMVVGARRMKDVTWGHQLPNMFFTVLIDLLFLG